jgi:23S rRNA pseudouridine2457 synthase
VLSISTCYRFVLLLLSKITRDLYPTLISRRRIFVFTGIGNDKQIDSGLHGNSREGSLFVLEATQSMNAKLQAGARLSSRYRHLMLHKPYGVLTKFTDSEGRPTLADYVVEPRVYPAGRLDMDSEGLLLLTSDGALAHRLTSPFHKVPKTYLVQVERIPDESALVQLRQGVMIKGKQTRQAKVQLLQHEPIVHTRPVPIRFRKSVPTVWLRMEIQEGMNRQIRHMTAQVGHPTLRVIRVAIGSIRLGSLLPGQWRWLREGELRGLF